MRGASHKLALGLLHYTYGVATGTVVVGNEMQVFYSFICCNEHRLKVLLKRHGITE